LVCFAFFPETVGDGLATFLHEHTSMLGVISMVIGHGLAMYYLIAPKSFTKNARKLGAAMVALFERVKEGNLRLPTVNSAAMKTWALSQVAAMRAKFGGPAVAVAAPVRRQLSATPTAAPLIPRSSPVAVEQVKEEDDTVDAADPEESEGESDEEWEAEEDTIDGEAEIEGIEADEAEEAEATPTMPFFASDELIDCISTSHRLRAQDPDEDYFRHIAAIIEDKLKEFGISSNVVNVMKGPVVDTFELNLGAGVKVSSVSNRADDVSLALSGVPIRIVYPMKGKTTVGVEVPRNPRDYIYLDDVLRSKVFRESQHNLPIAMGKDAYGEPSVVDLTSMPHMLAAGTTGSGKSVFINTLLVSLIVRNAPDRLKLILIDPKSVELALFQTLPHLIMPTLTDAGSASVALLWAVEEMERRYSLLKEVGVRNIDGYNKKIKDADGHLLARVKPHFQDDSEVFHLPFLVIVVDEVADLMQSKHGKEIETNVSRLAAKARAAGIHLVLATQRPSTDVITGVIKANFPTRIAFKVITNMDSRVILDTQGAEKLLGKGDMLFKQSVELIRVHSAYVDEAEIEKLVDKLGALPVQYSQAAIDFMETAQLGTGEGTESSPDSDGDVGPEDPLLAEAIHVVASTRQASASWLQRRMNVGYNRAAKLVEAMERRGVVGPGNGSKPRQVLVPPPDDLTS
jgi:S-DNA-T family DNA segregation ATPase FtsK/SpoIIIE